MAYEPITYTIEAYDMRFLLVPLTQARFDHRDVIYVIISRDPDGETCLLDVGQSPETGAPLMDAPDRRASWLRHSPTAEILVGVNRLPSDRCMKEDRARFVDLLRLKYQVPCGAV